MTMQLYVVFGASETTQSINFQSNGYTLLDGFYPQTADEMQESITDQFTVLITGSSADDLRAKIAAVTLMLEHARRHKNDSQAAWLHFCVDNPVDVMGTIPEWMSRMIGGMILYDKNLDRNWRRNKAVLSIIIEHKPYWDSDIEIPVPLTNGNGSRNTSGLTIYNHDDGGTSPAHDNWVDIEDSDVVGDIPGRTRLEVTNTYATSRLYTLWVGHNWTDPANLTHILEGEASSTGTATADAGCSGGYYMLKALASGAEDDLYTWTLSSAFLDACQGGWFKVLARFQAAAPTTVKFRLKLQFAATTIWQSGQVTLDTSRALQIRDLFTLRLPPWLLGQTDLSALAMILSGQQSSGSSIDIKLDFLQITPLDGYRMLECSGYGVLQNSRMVDDGVDEVAYVDDGMDDKLGYILGYGSPIALYPNKDQRLYFLMHSVTGNQAEILRTATVKLFYRPRRRTI